MSANPWTLAFKRAVEVEEEGAKDFVEIIAQHAQKKQRLLVDESTDGKNNSGREENSNAAAGKTESDLNSDGDEGVSSSGQSHLPQLSKFVLETTQRTLPNVKGNSDELDQTDSAVDNNVPQERDMVEVCGRQMCRAWLKHTYLQIGNPCKDGEACLRKHGVTCKPEHLYKDYSFKGIHMSRMCENKGLEAILMNDATSGSTEGGAKDALQGIRHITAAVNEVNASIPNQKLNEEERKQVQDAILKVAHGISQTLYGIDGMAAHCSSPNSEEMNVNEGEGETKEAEVQTEPSTEIPRIVEQKSNDSLALIALLIVASIAGLSLIISTAVLSITALSVGVYVVAKSFLN
eukprot:gene24075-27238_t